MSMKTDVQQDRSRIVVTGVASAALGAMFTLIGASAFGTSSPGAPTASPHQAAQVAPVSMSLPTTTYACVVPDVSLATGNSTNDSSSSTSHKASTSDTSDSATKNGKGNDNGKTDNGKTNDDSTDNGKTNDDSANSDSTDNGSSLIDADVSVGIASSNDQLADVTAGATVAGILDQVPVLDVDANAALEDSGSLLNVTGTVSGLHHIVGSPLAEAGLNVDILGDN